MTDWHEIEIAYDAGKIDVLVDGESRIRRLVYDETPLERGFFGTATDGVGTLVISDVEYGIANRYDNDYHWTWSAGSEELPDAYSRTRWEPIHRNTSPHPDHGYSTWVELEDGRLLVLDYTNEDAPEGKAYLEGFHVEV
jgi:hypothetical protein